METKDKLIFGTLGAIILTLVFSFGFFVGIEYQKARFKKAIDTFPLRFLIKGR